MKQNIVGHRTAANVAIRAAILALCALSLVACGDDDVGAPMIMIDAGRDMNTPPVDMFVPRDMPPACVPAAITPLPAAALPRCSAATQAAVVACGDRACLQAALDADTTAPLVSGGQTLDCGGCFNVQQIACVYANDCDAQLDAFLCCVNAAGCTDPNVCPACTTQAGAFNTCAQGTPCFDATMGELDGCFAEPTPPTDGGVPADGGPAPDAGTETDGGTAG